MKINKITEEVNSKTKNIDQNSIDEILISINNEDQLIADQVKKVIPEISSFIEKIIEKLKKSGRLIYIGSGTSGRLGVLDASECPPTFGVSKNLVIGLIAGGDRALKESIEGAEDSLQDSVNLLKEINFNKNDVILGISASGTTPYVIAALEYAKKIGSSTGFLTCNNISSLECVDYLIRVIVGAEVLSGSTRLKAGTATKMVLNMISTASMMKMNRTFGNMMVDLLPNNNKLIQRAINIISKELNVDNHQAKKLYKLSRNNLKAAILMGKKNITLNQANKIIIKNKGSLLDSLNEQ